MKNISGYEYNETVHENDRVIVFRAKRNTDGTTVIVKTYKSDYPSLKDLARLRHEYNITKGLKMEGIVRSISLEKYGNGLALIREDFLGTPLNILIEEGLPIEDFFRYAIALTEALSDIHKKGIIHKDIKPANVLIEDKSHALKLTDFGISSKLERQTHNPTSPDKLEGSLVYMSPEQTGRMNRALDYRSDFYSLGVTFYEMLTGKVPFTSRDAMEMVHQHIAMVPESPHEVNSKVPYMVSAIIMKLLSKTAEERYRSSTGIIADLKECEKQWKKNGKVKDFTLAQKDVSESFHISQKLYGRETELQMLLDGFESAAEGKNNMMLVSGYSGTGKSALVNEVHKPIARQKGYFISGKFDQYKRNIPYDALLQALNELIRQVLTESEDKIRDWRRKLLDALGPNGQLMIDAVSDLEIIIGKQPSVAPLPPSESQNRLRSVFHSFINVFAQKSHPLVMFLDDLQWADSSSFRAIKNIMLSHEINYFYFIGAYRDNEVDGTHPLTAMLDELKTSGKEISGITIKPLSEDNINALIADSFYYPKEKTKELTRLVYSKTHGNPFFVIEFLKTLYTENLLYFDNKLVEWKWDVDKIWEKDITDNVVDLMASKVKKLEKEIQSVIKLAACIGNQFDLGTLSVVNGTSTSETNALLWEIMKEGMIIPLNQNFRLADEDSVDATTILMRFKHDRVQQAAYSLIEEKDRRNYHLKIGRLMLENTSAQNIDEKVFDIANQYNEGVFGNAKTEEEISLLVSQLGTEEKASLAQINKTAGEKAKFSTAYDAAFRYFSMATHLLPATSWQNNYDFTFSVYLDLAESAYLLNNQEEAEKNFKILLEHAANKVDIAKVYSIKIILYTTAYNFPGALEVGKEAMAYFNDAVPENLDEAMGAEIGKVLTNPIMQDMDKIVDLPVTTDPEKIEFARLIGTLQTPAYYINPNLWSYFVSKQMNYALEHGNTPISPMGYLGFALILGNGVGNFTGADKLGLISLKVNDIFQGKENLAKLHMVHYGMNNHYAHHVKTSIPELKVALQYALETGDFVYYGFSILHIILANMYKNTPLDDFMAEINKYEEYVKRIPSEMQDVITLFRQVCLTIKGETENGYTMSSSKFNEEEFHEKLKKNINPIPLFSYCMIKMQLLYMHGKYAEAGAYYPEAEKAVPYSYANYNFSEFFYINALVLATVLPYVGDAEKEQYSGNIETLQTKMKGWAEACPENWMHKYCFVEAIRARNRGENEQAAELYSKAIQHAGENELILDNAIINESAAVFYHSLNNTDKVKNHAQDAHYFYKQFGAKVKAKEIEAAYPDYVSKQTHERHSHHDTSTSFTSTTTVESTSMLDIATIMKSVHTISEERSLPSLLSKTISFFVENTGAQRGAMILSRDGKWLLEAEYEAGDDNMKVLSSIPVNKATGICQAVVNYVSRTGENIILEDAQKSSQFMQDAYITKNNIRSVLCIPFKLQGKITGILYFENNLTTNAFTQERVEVIKILSTQVAVSVESAILFDNLEQKVEQRTQEISLKNAELSKTLKKLQDAQNQLVQAEKLASLGQLTAGIAHEIQNPLNFVNNFSELSAEMIEEADEDLKKLRGKGNDDLVDNIDAILKDISKNVIKINEHGKRADAIVKGMLMHSRADKGKMEPIDINYLVDEYTNLAYQSTKTDKGGRVEVEKILDDSLEHIDAIGQDISRVLVNVLNNAFYAANERKDKESNGFAPKVIVKTINHPDYIEIKIRDNGMGIPENIRENIFNPFFTTKPTGEGTGLGLSLSYDIIVQGHGGEIKLDTEQGSHTEFSIILPKQKKEVPA